MKSGFVTKAVGNSATLRVAEEMCTTECLEDGGSNCTAQNDPANHLESILSWGMKAGKWAGVVTTTRITHASPGGAYAHIANRDWEDDHAMASDSAAVDPQGCKDIARQLVEDAPGKDLRVIMGGGRRGFLPISENSKGRRKDSRNLINTWKDMKKGEKASYIETKKELDAVDVSKTDYLLGLFEWSHMQYHLDADETQPSLADMVKKAVSMLSRQEKGFVLFVEGGRIDHGHHATMAHYALDETKEFSEAIQAAVDITKEEETLIVVTSDHAHTMSVAGYAKRGNDIFGFGGKKQPTNHYSTLSYANGPGFRPWGKDVDDDDMQQKDYMFPATANLTSETHGGDDVGIFARGPWAHLYTGVHEQNLIPNIAAYAAAIGPFEGRPVSAAGYQQVALESMIMTLLVSVLGRVLL